LPFEVLERNLAFVLVKQSKVRRFIIDIHRIGSTIEKKMITRRLKLLFIFGILLCTTITVFAQRKKQPTGPRAVAVIESTPKGLVLVPVSLMLDGRFYDATLYHANPVPMALDPGNVYEVQRSGDGIGDFTITNTEQWPTGAWLGRGTWLSDEEKHKREEARAKAKSKPAAKPAEDEDEGPPKLTRGGPKKEEAAPASPPKPEPKPDVASTEPPDNSGDTDRPILRRGKAEQEQAEKLGGGDTATTAAVPVAPIAGFEQMKVAVSDASDTDSRTYVWKWANSEEEKKIRASIQSLAMTAVKAYAAKSNGPPPGDLENIDIRAFDLEYNNSADVVLSARVRPARVPAKKTAGKAAPAPVPAPSGFEYYVTIVAREDIYSQLEKTFVAVTDSRHLDAFPRMQLIDAVDADGNGGGDLLFRRTSDLGSAFVLYRVNSSRLEEILRVPEPKLD
jgi:hypothetical protein